MRGEDEAVCGVCGKPPTGKVVSGAAHGGKRYDVLYCRTCGVGLTVPRPSEEELLALYAPGRYREEEGNRFHPAVERLIRWSRGGKADRIERWVRRGAILDIGCGRGVFLDLMRNRGWIVAGAEANGETARALSARRGFPVYSGPPEGWGIRDGAMDVVTLNHVLEHMGDPAAIIRECSRILRPGGLLVVGAPNFGSWQAVFGGKAWFHLDPPFHLHHFSLDGLSRLLARGSFRILAVRHMDWEYNPYGWLQTLLNRTGIPKNFLYEMLRTGGGAAGRGSAMRLGPALATFFLLPPYAFLSGVLSLLEAAAGRGGTVELCAQREEGGTGAAISAPGIQGKETAV